MQHFALQNYYALNDNSISRLSGMLHIAVLFCVFLTLPLRLEASDIRTSIFTDAKGLASNLTKDVIQDRDGFLWISTDAGIVRYDGRNFVSFNDGLPSLYVKQMLTGPDGRIYVANDLGVGILKRNKNSFRYMKLIEGASYQSDSRLYYPKSMYFDKNGNLWISEKESISRFKNGRLKKYYFSPKYYSDSFLRSFCFAEDSSGRLFVSSWRGYLFYYNDRSDTFTQLIYTPQDALMNINQIRFVNNKELWAATGLGLYKFIITDIRKTVSVSPVLKLSAVSSFGFNTAGDLYIGTWMLGAFICEGNPGQENLRHIDEIEFNVINKIQMDREGLLWLSSDDGLALIQETFFARAAYDRQPDRRNTSRSYILGLMADENGRVYFSDQESIYRVEESLTDRSHYPYRFENVKNSMNKRVLSFDVHNGEMWVSYRNGLLEYSGTGRKKFFTEKELHGRISALKIDKHGNLWGYNDRTRHVISIDRNFTVREISDTPLPGEVLFFEFAPDGTAYCVLNDEKHFLLSFNPYKFKFDDLSKRVKLSSPFRIMIHDLFIDDDNTLWIASNHGLQKLKKHGTGEKIVIDGLETPAVKAIHIDQQKRIWLGTELGVYLFYNEQLVAFNKNDGLPNSSVSSRSVVMDGDNRLWVGTASGLAYWQKAVENIRITPTPVFTRLTVNGNSFEILENGNSFTGNSDLEASFGSLSFPDRILYQTKLLGFKDEWSEPGSQNNIVYSNLPPGEYTLLVKAQQSGCLPSDVLAFRLIIMPPWYQSWWMYFIYLIIVLSGITWFVSGIEKRKFLKLEKRKRELEKLVHEKTRDLKEEKEITESLLQETEKAKRELERVNADLKRANELKSDLLSIAAHDLKNPLQAIIGFSRMIKEEMGNPNISHMGNIIYNSSLRMLNLITELLDSVAVESTKLVLKTADISLVQLTDKVIAENRHRAGQKRQNIVFTRDRDYLVSADEKWFGEALDNLISNAVKYSPAGKTIYVDICGDEEFVRICVKDEGPGLTDEDKRLLFGKFQRLSAKPTAGESSTGLGLSIVKEIISLHGGRIWAESMYGAGTSFIVEMKVSKVILAI
ncbi:MAG: two-component regulator propeller domain-containing protein [Bacteroidota bacterium]